MVHLNPKKLVLFGAACSPVTDQIAKAAKHWNLVQVISFISWNYSLNNIFKVQVLKKSYFQIFLSCLNRDVTTFIDQLL